MNGIERMTYGDIRRQGLYRQEAIQTQRVPKEADEQKAIFRWAAYETARHPELQLLHAIPNGGSRDPREAHNLKLQGVKAGVPDMCLPVPRGDFAGLYIELKRVRGGRLSDEQRGWIEALRRTGHRVEVCKGAQEAVAVITSYLEGS